MSAVDALIFFLLAVLLVIAPLIFGGNHPLPRLVTGLLSLFLFLLFFLKTNFQVDLPKSFVVALAVLVLVPLLQLLPLPLGLWMSLPGREFYARAMAGLGVGDGMQQISLVPALTETAWLAIFPPLAVFLVTLNHADGQVKRLVYLFLAIAAFQALLVLTQFGGGTSTTFRMNQNDVGNAVGTYVNRNHVAGLLEMALPIAMGLLASRIGRGEQSIRYSGRNWLKKMALSLKRLPRPNQTMLFAALVIALILGIIFSRSRTGIMMGMIGTLLSALLYGQHIGGARSNKLVSLFVTAGLALAAIIGLTPVLDRFSVVDALGDARWLIYATSLEGLWEFFPVGSGLGTFSEVFWRYQPDSISKFVNYVHNDYIELVFETGLAGMIVIVLLLAHYALRWPSLIRGSSWGTLTFMQIGAGIGLFLMALHSLTDFNLHIPANAIYFAFLAGVFFHRPEARHAGASKEKRAVKEQASQELPDMLAPLPKPVAKPKGSNPFAD